MGLMGLSYNYTDKFSQFLIVIDANLWLTKLVPSKWLGIMKVHWFESTRVMKFSAATWPNTCFLYFCAVHYLFTNTPYW